jgi:hypothetical protein
VPGVAPLTTSPQMAKVTCPLAVALNSAQASPAWPLKSVSSQLQKIFRMPAVESSRPIWLRSFWFGWSSTNGSCTVK